MWSPFVAYCVGLITTDGCLSPDKRHVDFTSKDRELVEYICSCLGPRNSICMKRGGNGRWYFRVQLSSVAVYRWLGSIGLTPRKSLTLGALAIPDLWFADFLRGHLDGDGNITTYDDPTFPTSRRLYVRFTSGSYKHLEWLQHTTARLWSLRGFHTSVPRAFRLNFAKRESIELLRHLYYASELPCLRRKQCLAAPFLGRSAEVAELADATVSEAVG